MTALRALAILALAAVLLGLGLVALEGLAAALGFEPLARDESWLRRARHASCQFGYEHPRHRCARPLPASGERLVFAIGGSNVRGPRSERAERFPAQLQRMLDASRPGEFRVVNLGRPCKDSTYVRRCAELSMAERPEFVVVYTGHNDYANWGFENPARAIFLEEHAWLYDVERALAHTRAYTAVRAWLAHRPGDSTAAGRPGASDRALYSDEVFERASATILDKFTRNMETIVELAAEQGAQVILVTVASNLHEYPFDRSRWDAVGDPGAAPTPRERRWRRLYREGIARYRAGAFEEALDAFRRARDTLPSGRAPGALNDRIREIAARHRHVHLVDLERRLEQLGLEAGVGCNFFGFYGRCDQFHLNAAAHRLLARELLDTIEGAAPSDRAGGPAP